MSQKKQWLYGHHTVKAALGNPKRRLFKLIIASKDLQEIPDYSQAGLVSKSTFDDLFGPQAVHQNVAGQFSCLPRTHIEDLYDSAESNAFVLILDQVTDPHNVGAILRSAAAFGAKALVSQDRNSPEETNPILAKTASGALEKVPLISVTNIARALADLKKNGYWIAGLDETGQSLPNTTLHRPLALILGAEGKGMRRLLREKCDLLVSLPTESSYTTLNVSNAAAVAMYALHTSRQGTR